MTATIALAIPTCADWLPDRAESLSRLLESLHPHSESRMVSYREFRERASNRVWPPKMWRWGLDTGATHLLQLQDDAVVSPNFWRALAAMLDAHPGRLIGLHSNHPLAPAQYKAGRHWYRDHWLTGPAYVFPRDLLERFIEWCEDNPDLVELTNEDSLICKWSEVSKNDVWHPVPTITSVDQGVPSTYGNDGHHEFSMYRVPPVTWRDAPSLAALEDPAYWRCTEESAPKLPGPGTQLCWFCADKDGPMTSQKTGARICKHCLGAIMGNVLSRVP